MESLADATCVVPVVWTRFQTGGGELFSFEKGSENGQYRKTQEFMDDDEAIRRIIDSAVYPKPKASTIPSHLPAPDKGNYSYLIGKDHFLGTAPGLGAFLPQWCDTNMEKRTCFPFGITLRSLLSFNAQRSICRKATFLMKPDGTFLAPFVLIEFIVNTTLSADSLIIQKEYRSYSHSNFKEYKFAASPNTKGEDFETPIEANIQVMRELVDACVADEKGPDSGQLRNELLQKFWSIEKQLNGR